MRLMIFDDNRTLLDSIELLMEASSDIEVVGAYTHAQYCEEMVRKGRPDVVLMDIDMPGINGIKATMRIKKEFPQVQILMQTVFEDDDKVFDSICAGASGYILKNELDTKLIQALNEAYTGGSPMSAAIARKVLSRMQQIPQHFRQDPEEDFQLTPRETEVLQCIVEGLSHKMIAGRLDISYETVRSHVKKIYEKLHVASLTEAVAKAITKKLV